MNSTKNDIRSRIAEAMTSLVKFENVWLRKRVSLTTKMRVLDTSIIPTAIYGCEAWTILKHDIQRINAFGMKCLRRILGIHWSDHITNVDICNRTNGKPDFVYNIIKKRQHTWLDHVLRMEGSRLPVVTLQAHAHDTRNKGGQRTRWIDNVLGYSKLSLPQALVLAKDRNRWRNAFS